MENPDVGTRPAGYPTGTTLLTFGGLAAAFGAASCCGIPLLLASLGLGSVWLTGLALLAGPHRVLLLVLGGVGLAGGGYLLWRQRRLAACLPGAVCARPAFRLTIAAGLFVGALLFYVGIAYA